MLSSASCGMPVGYSAILLPQLKADNGSLNIDDEIGSWIGKDFTMFRTYKNIVIGCQSFGSLDRDLVSGTT